MNTENNNTTGSNSIQIVDKAYKQADGSEIIAHMIRLGGEEYLTVAEAAEAFGVTPATIRQLVIKHGLVVVDGVYDQIQILKSAGVIPFKTTVVNLLPRATIDELLRIINTDEAKAAYKQILGEWRDARKAAAPNATAVEHLAEAVRQMMKVVAGATDLSLEVNKRVDAVATSVASVAGDLAAVVDDVAVVQQRAGDSLMTALEMNNLQRAIYRCAVRLGFKPGAIMREIKERFLPAKLAAGRTWKEIPSSTFDEAMEFCNTWEPMKQR